MKEFVQNILIYVIIITVLRGLITNARYQQYFQFFSGVVLILLFLSPVLSFLQGDREWFHILEEKLLQMDMADIQGEMKVAEQDFEKMLQSRYEEVVREQVELIAREKGVSIEDTQVVLEKEGDTWKVAKVQGRISEEDGKEGAYSKEYTDDKEGKGDVAVEAVTIGEEPMEKKEQDTSRRGRELKKQICDSFTLGKEQVYLWK